MPLILLVLNNLSHFIPDEILKLLDSWSKHLGLLYQVHIPASFCLIFWLPQGCGVYHYRLLNYHVVVCIFIMFSCNKCKPSLESLHRCNSADRGTLNDLDPPLPKQPKASLVSEWEAIQWSLLKLTQFVVLFLQRSLIPPILDVCFPHLFLLSSGNYSELQGRRLKGRKQAWSKIALNEAVFSS